MQNPFNIAFGKEPYSLISREGDFQEIYDSFSSDNPSTNVYILTGIRGSGKTVAMTNISNYYKNKDWLCIDLNPESDMLEQLASKLYDEGKLKKLFIKTEFNFSFSGIGFQISGKEPISNVSSFLKREFEYLKKKNIKVLVTVDEAVSNNYMKVFAHEFQSLIREKYFICLLMTGLYNNISLLEKQKSLTFLYRAPKIYLGPLNGLAIANSYRKIFNISDKESIELAKLTKGYAFAYQLLGNLLFSNNKKVPDEDILDKYDELLQERAYRIIYSELSEKEKDVLKLASYDNSNEYILSRIDISRAQLSNIKKTLQLKGIIEDKRGVISFLLPRFSEILLFLNAYED